MDKKNIQPSDKCSNRNDYNDFPFLAYNKKLNKFLTQYSNNMLLSVNMPIFKKFLFKNLVINPTFIDGGEIEQEELE